MRLLRYAGLTPGVLQPQFDRIVAAFERDDLQSVDLKKLHGGLYRVKLSDAARLILQFVTFAGERAALALELLPNHEYDRSRFLRGAVIDDQKVVAPEPALEATPIRYLHRERTTFELLDKPLSFDDAQEQVLRATPPLIIVGSAGSGKTALLLSHLRQAQGSVAYLTESAWLAQSARSQYVAHGYEPVDQETDFLSYRQLLEGIEVPTGKPVGFREFSQFFEPHRPSLRFTDAHRCFEELRGVLTARAEGVLSREQYLALGVKQSLFDEQQRAHLFEAFQRYPAWLESQGLFEPNLVAAQWVKKAQPRYDMLAIDEVQDLTPVQLALALACLKPHGSFVLAGDANQVVHPNFFSWSGVRALFWSGQVEGAASTASVLKVSYRNAPRITQLANEVLALKHAKFGSIDRESDVLLEAIAGEPGEVQGVALASPRVAELDAMSRRSVKVAVLVLRDDDKAKARERFKTPLVFSVLESKGLEYETVILFGVIGAERKIFAELASGVTRAELEVTELRYGRGKDKTDKTSEAYKFFVNALYVCLTRAVKTVWVVEEEVDHPLLRLLSVPFDGAKVVPAAAASSIDEWQREAARLEAQGKLEQVEAIRSSVLKTQATPWKTMDAAAAQALIDKALDPKGVSSKAREQLFELSCVHQLIWAEDGLRALKALQGDLTLRRNQTLTRLLQDALSKRPKVMLESTEKYGLEYRSPTGLTPLMMAARALNVELVEALLARGASIHERDLFGLQAFHHLIRAGVSSEGDEAHAPLRALWESLAPPSFDLQVGSRSIQLGREQGAYFVFSQLVEQMTQCAYFRGQPLGLGTAHLLDGLEGLPFQMLPEHRRKRQYVSQVLSINEVSRETPGGKRLFKRMRHGSYVINPEVRLRTDAGWASVGEVTGEAIRLRLAAHDLEVW